MGLLSNKNYSMLKLSSILRELGGLDSKESACNAGDPGSIPGSGRFPWRRKWQPTPIFLLGKSHGQRSLVDYSPWGHKESDTTERLSMHACMGGDPGLVAYPLSWSVLWSAITSRDCFCHAEKSKQTACFARESVAVCEVVHLIWLENNKIQM